MGYIQRQAGIHGAAAFRSRDEVLVRGFTATSIRVQEMHKGDRTCGFREVRLLFTE